MPYDYYASKYQELQSHLDRMIEISNEKPRNGEKRTKLQRIAEKIVPVEPHLAYLWFAAHPSGNHQLCADAIRDIWCKHPTIRETPWQRQHFDFAQLPSDFDFLPDISAVAYLPPLSFMICIPFQLEKPYLSKDERLFYLLDNPLRREKVFRTPMIAATSWKGSLRAAMVRQLVDWWNGLDESEKRLRRNRKCFVARRIQLTRLFGTEKGTASEEQQRYSSYLDEVGSAYQARWYHRYMRLFVSKNGFVAGRLYFYPTFLDQVGLEVINPHDRATGVGKHGPIFMECASQGAKGKLVLTYVPFGPVEESAYSKIVQDLKTLVQGIKAMLTEYGFGAKTTSGFGIAADQLPSIGRLAIRLQAPGSPPPDTQSTPQQTNLPRYLESPEELHSDLRRPDGSLKSEEEYRTLIEGRGEKYTKRKKQLYTKAKNWWQKRGKELRDRIPEEESEPVISETPPVPEFTFQKLDELCDLIPDIENYLREEIESDIDT